MPSELSDWPSAGWWRGLLRKIRLANWDDGVSVRWRCTAQCHALPWPRCWVALKYPLSKAPAVGLPRASGMASKVGMASA